MVLRGDPLFVRYGACRLLTLLAQSGTPQSCGAGPSARQPMGREQRKRRGRGSRGGRQKLPGLRRVGLGSEGGRRAGAELGPETPSRPERGERRSEASCGRGEWRTATVGRLRRTRRCCRRRRVPSLVGPRTQRQRAASTAARTSCGRGGGVEGPPRGTPAEAGSGGVLAGAPRARVGLRGEKCWKGCGEGDGRRREGVRKEQGSGWEKDTRPRGAEVPWGKPAGRPACGGRSAGREGGGSGPGPRGRGRQAGRTHTRMRSLRAL